MATTAPVSPDTLITIKLLTGAENRRFKLPLKDLTAQVLPQKLRALLAVPENKKVIFERYSDSAGNYVKLDTENVSVFKQLHRAAKAKLKLRIKATILLGDDEVPAAKSVQSMPLDFAQVQMKAINASIDAHHRYQQEQMKDLQRNEVIGQSQPSVQSSLAEKWAPAISQAMPSATQTPLKHTNTTEDQKQADYQLQLMLLEQANRKRLMQARQQQKEQEEEAAKVAEAAAEIKQEEEPVCLFGIPGAQFSVCCNHCHADIPGAHWHCSVCVEGDYDLCQDCVEAGEHCFVDCHFLIKRVIENGRVINSTNEKAPKKILSEKKAPEIQAIVEDFPMFKTESVEHQETFVEAEEVPGEELSRTCNACVNIFDESNFVTCLDCDDYDLCMSCHICNSHGHHPGHMFAPVSKQTEITPKAAALCASGRDVRHAAVCDGCDKSIKGIRNKCLTCPDWDYCSMCVQSAHIIHPGHRFAPIYEPVSGRIPARSTHYGIRCDGPLCKSLGRRSFITGDRYKCAVCHDTDFCARCEALPASAHNRTHPLIKFRTPIANCSITTYNEKTPCSAPETLGDRIPQTMSKSTETTPSAPSANAATQVQTVAENKPIDVVEVLNMTAPKVDSVKSNPSRKLQAIFVRDSVPDGTIMEPDTTFQQTWTLRNPGPHDWPAGCALRFTGGDRMLNIDSQHPASVSDLDKAQSSEPINRVVKTGEEVSLTMTLRAPSRPGNYISYWRLKSDDGTPFGHRLWCDIHALVAPQAAVVSKVEESKPESLAATTEDLSESQMIFPTLEKESPYSSVHEDTSQVPVAPSSISPEDQAFLDDVESLGIDDESSTDDGFLTDEEYEILDNDSEADAAKNGKA